MMPTEAKFQSYVAFTARSIFKYLQTKAKIILKKILNKTIKWGSRPTRLLPHAKILLIPIKFFFLCWVDYALEGSTFSLSKCDFSRMFHTERS